MGIEDIAAKLRSRVEGSGFERSVKLDTGADGVIELTYQVGIENMRARMNSALGITEQGFGSGDSCRVPWAT